jgi:antitoxin HicB
MNYHYTIVIQWSIEDDCFVVSLPEWGKFCHTHGDTYEAALTNAQEVLEMLIEGAIADSETLPPRQTAKLTRSPAQSQMIRDRAFGHGDFVVDRGVEDLGSIGRRSHH